MVKIVLGVLIIAFSLGAWQKDGVPIATGPGGNTEPKIVTSDSTFTVVYRTTLQPIVDKLQAAKVNTKTGNVIWNVLVSEDTTLGYRYQQVVAGQQGVLWVTFERVYPQNPYFLIGLQKLGPNGERLLGKDGINISPSQEMQEGPQLCLDGSGEGCYVTWTDFRSGNADVWAARVTKEGQVEWEKMVGTTQSIRENPYILGIQGNALIFFTGWVGIQGGIICQKIDQDGNRCFGPDGLFVADGDFLLFPGDGNDITPSITADSSNAFVAFLDGGGPYIDSAFVQKLTDSIPQWGANTWLAPCVGTNGFTIVPDFSGGILTAFQPEWGYRAVWAQAVSSEGNLRFGIDGLKVWEDPLYPYIGGRPIWMKGTEDGVGGMLIVWDTKSDSAQGDIMAARIDTAKSILWTTEVCTAIGDQIYPTVTRSDSNFIIVWQDERNGNWDLYAQCLDLDGNVGIEEKQRVETHNPPVLQIYPNPFSRSTIINFQLSLSGRITVNIYNAIGQVIRTLTDSKNESGSYLLSWDGRDDSGKTVPSGVYLCELRLRSGDENLKAVKKIVLINQWREHE